MTDSTPYADLRVSYNNEPLERENLATAPLVQFESWFADVVAEGLAEPNAMVVATADEQGQPSARHVLLKQADARGFVFYSNYESRKGRELAVNPHASLVFPWFAMYRQVTVIGDVQKVSREEAQAYFDSRPHGSRVGAWASRQSEVLESREELEQRWADFAEMYPEGSHVPLPEWWGGYIVVPRAIEFWAGRRSRLHDRWRYVRDESVACDLTDPSQWRLERLSP